MKKTLMVALTVVWLSALLIFNACNSQPTTSEGFAIYLTRDNISVSQMPALSHIDIADEPFISSDDIVWYYKDTHIIELTAKAYERVNNIMFPTSGKVFVVCIDKQPIYWGAFWPGYSSALFDGIVIGVNPISRTENRQNSIQIRLGYPSASFFQGEDPRANPVIMQSLEQAGKLK